MADDQNKITDDKTVATSEIVPEMLGVDLAQQLNSDGSVSTSPVAVPVISTPVQSNTPTPEAQTDQPPVVSNDVPIDDLPKKEEVKVPLKEFSLEAQKDIVDQTTDTYVPHPLGNSD